MSGGPGPTRWPLDLPPRLLAAVAAAAASEVSGVALTATAAWLIARAAERPPLAAIALAVVAVRALALGRGVLRYAERLTGHDSALTALAAARERIFAAVVPLAPGGLPAFRDGDLLVRMVSDVDAVQDVVLRCGIPAAATALTAAVAVPVVAVTHPLAGLVLGCALILMGVVLPAAAIRGTRARAGREASARAELAAHAVDVVRGAAELVAYGAQARSAAAGAQAAARLARIEAAGRGATRRTDAATLAVQALVPIAVIAVAVPAVADGTMSGVAQIVLVIAATALAEVAGALPAAGRRWAVAAASLTRVRALLVAEPPVPEPTHPHVVPVGPGWVRVCALRVRHPGTEVDVLDGLDLDLAPGSRTAIVGPSGVGKSTLVATLLRFVEPAAGTVTIDGVDVRAMRGDDVRAVIGGLPQGAHVFHASLRTNLLLGDPRAGDDVLRAALADVGLDGWTAGLIDGLDTVLGERGARMSGGQRQRLVLARALLADPPVLVLDEPTEGLDTATARAVMAAIMTRRAGRTVIVIAHDLDRLDLDKFTELELAGGRLRLRATT